MISLETSLLAVGDDMLILVTYENWHDPFVVNSSHLAGSYIRHKHQVSKQQTLRAATWTAIPNSIMNHPSLFTCSIGAIKVAMCVCSFSMKNPFTHSASFCLDRRLVSVSVGLGGWGTLCINIVLRLPPSGVQSVSRHACWCPIALLSHELSFDQSLSQLMPCTSGRLPWLKDTSSEPQVDPTDGNNLGEAKSISRPISFNSFPWSWIRRASDFFSARVFCESVMNISENVNNFSPFNMRCRILEIVRRDIVWVRWLMGMYYPKFPYMFSIILKTVYINLWAD